MFLFQPTKSKVWFCMVSSGSVHMPFAKHHGSAFLTCEHMLFALKFGLSVSYLHRNRKFQDKHVSTPTCFVVLQKYAAFIFCWENNKKTSADITEKDGLLKEMFAQNGLNLG